MISSINLYLNIFFLTISFILITSLDNANVGHIKFPFFFHIESQCKLKKKKKKSYRITANDIGKQDSSILNRKLSPNQPYVPLSVRQQVKYKMA